MRTLSIRALVMLEVVSGTFVALWVAYFAMHVALIRQGEVKGVSLFLGALAFLGIAAALHRDPRRLLLWMGPFCVFYASGTLAIVGVSLMVTHGQVVPRLVLIAGGSAAIHIAAWYWLSWTSRYRDGAVDDSASSSGPKPCD